MNDFDPLAAVRNHLTTFEFQSPEVIPVSTDENILAIEREYMEPRSYYDYWHLYDVSIEVSKGYENNPDALRDDAQYIWDNMWELEEYRPYSLSIEYGELEDGDVRSFTARFTLEIACPYY